jgi:phenylalanyl-tRNA synthetase beta chain
MKISYNWLKEYVKNLPNPEKLADLLTMHSFEVEGIEKVGNDYVLDIDVLPNRAHDCLSHIGVARECAALISGKLRVTDYKLQESKVKVENFVSVEVKDSELCPRYTARVMTDIKVGPSPKWLRERLEAVGQQSINNIVDATNYVAFEIGQPLHAFDAEKLTGKKIIIRRAKKGEKIVTLDNEKCDLDNDVLIIADSKDPIAIAGIKGGKKAEIDKNTKTIILESANFNLHNVHKSSRKLGIATESSLRFEHGLDPNLASEAIDRLAGLIQKIAGGKITKGMIDVYPIKLRPRKIGVGLFKVNNLLGVKISETEVIKIFDLLGFKVEKKIDRLLVEVPTRRLDIEIPEDLIEEVGRIYGYEKIPSKPPLGILVSAKPDDLRSLRNKVKDILEGLGLSEVYNYSFIGEEDLKKLKQSPKNYIELENPLSVDLKYLRRDLIIGTWKSLFKR